jgi:hypothetical protein
MAMGVGLRPTAKAVEAPPNPKARALRLYPDFRTHGSARGDARKSVPYRDRLG